MNNHCEFCNELLSPQVSNDGLYYWCFFVKDPKGTHGYSEVRLGSTINDREEMLTEFEKEMPQLEVIGYTSIDKRFLKEQRQIFVVIDGQLCLNPEIMLQLID